MLDSGAFSCWRKQETINLDEYLRFIEVNRDDITVPVGLDVIPGQRGRAPTPAEVEASAREGYTNALYARRRGVEVMPVFHAGECFSWLSRMVDDGWPWIGIAPRNDAQNGPKRAWLDKVFGHLCGDRGYPSVRIHGFGVSAPAVMCRYPWTTVDSMSWLIQANMGNIFLPRRALDGEWDFIRPIYLPMSTRTGPRPNYAMASRPGNHWDTIGDTQRDAAHQYLGELEHFLDMDIDTRTLGKRYQIRDVVNICGFLRALEENPMQPFRRKRGGFHDDSSERCEGLDVPMWERTRLLFTTPLSPLHGWALNRCGVRDRLLTYYLIRDKPFDVAAYNATGSMEIANDVSKTSTKAGPIENPIFGCRRAGDQGFGTNP